MNNSRRRLCDGKKAEGVDVETTYNKNCFKNLFNSLK